MNERRDELVGKVAAKLEKYADDYAAWEAGGLEDTGLEDSRQIAAEIIALVTAARDAEIRELLLAPEAAQAAGLHLSKFALLPDFYRTDPEYKQQTDDLAAGVTQAALDHIGLHSDGTGGQG